jgi:hypothetical protein
MIDTAKELYKAREQIAELKAENKELRSWYNEGTASNKLKADAIREMLSKMKFYNDRVSVNHIEMYADNLEDPYDGEPDTYTAYDKLEKSDV